MNNKLIFKKQITVILFSILVAIFLSNLTEDELKTPVTKTMNLLSGGGYRFHIIDDKGVPKVFYPRLKDSYYNTVYVTIYAFTYYEKFMNNNEDEYFLKYYNRNLPKVINSEKYKEFFLNCADWLRNNMEIRSFEGIAYGIWTYNFPWYYYKLEAPWVSGMAQGVGIQILIRAYKITGNQEYLDAAKKALNSFLIETKTGGVTYKDSSDEWWYEEYAGKDAIQSRVLNGMEHSLIALDEYYKVTNDVIAKDLFEKGLKSVKSRLQDYDAGWWTNYDALKKTGSIANKKYHYVNIALTKKLYEITNDEIFLKYSEKWSKYNSPFIVREFIRQKPNYYDVAMLGFNIAIVFIIIELFLLIRFLGKKTFKKGICHITSVHTASDVRVFHKQAKSLANAGYTVTLIVPHGKDEFIDNIKILSVKQPKSRINRILIVPWKILWKALKQKSKLYHFHDPELIPVGVLLKVFGAKLIYDVHEDYSASILSKTWLPMISRKTISLIFSFIEKMASFSFDHIITATDHIATKFNKDKITVIHNYPILEYSKNKVSNKVIDKIDKFDYIIIYAGNLTRIRGIYELVKAMEYIDNNLNLKLKLLGEFTDPDLEKDIKALSGFSRVEYVGYVPYEEVNNHLAEADIGIVLFHPLPNHIESMPNKIFEYMIEGLPIIASNFPLWRNIIEESRCGLTVNPLDPKDIASKIEYMIQNPMLMKEMSENGKKFAIDKYNWESESKKLIKLYKEIIGES